MGIVYFRPMFYWAKGNKLLQTLYPNWIWSVRSKEKKIYLSFDDGPHPEITPWVLDQLKAWHAKATFFCIGKNVAAYPEIYQRILMEGHRTGNHTMNHLNGWKTNTADYFNNILEAGKYIDSKLFRPPYGKLTRFQGKALRDAGYEIIMWTLLSADFDIRLSPSDCWELVQKNYRAGTILVFHDSEKAWPRLQVVLPKLLEEATAEGYTFEELNMGSAIKNRGQ
jgi:peptidoglycan/xylan/chitin deacetylase (PgdA/CDA1 family)